MGFFANLFKAKAKGGRSTKGLKIIDLNKRFDLQGRTGQGSMSKVFKAYDKDLGRTVCLKLLDKVKTKKFDQRFTLQGLSRPLEGEICFSLKHINCVKTYEYGMTNEGEQYLVMEWIEGLGLNYLVETRSPKLEGQKVQILVQLCEAMQYIHDQKYLHRDLCPRNVMVDNEGIVKLIDFGLTIPYTPAFCTPGNRTGTVDYLAPEVIKRMTTDHRVDLFALGVTAFEVFTFQLPWERSLNSEETLRRHLNTKPRQALDLNPKLDEELNSVLAKSIERDRALRYNTANQFKEALLALKKKNY